MVLDQESRARSQGSVHGYIPACELGAKAPQHGRSGPSVGDLQGASCAPGGDQTCLLALAGGQQKEDKLEESSYQLTARFSKPAPPLNLVHCHFGQIPRLQSHSQGAASQCLILGPTRYRHAVD